MVVLVRRINECQSAIRYTLSGSKYQHLNNFNCYFVCHMQKVGSFFVAIMINYLSMASSDQCAIGLDGTCLPAHKIVRLLDG